MAEFSEYLCSHCDMKFTLPAGKKIRCPTCLRSQGIIPVTREFLEGRAKVPKKRMTGLLLLGFLIVVAVGAGALYLVSRKSASSDAKKDLMSRLRGYGIKIAKTEVDILPDEAVEKAAFKLSGGKNGREKAIAIFDGVTKWVSDGKLKKTADNSTLVPEPMVPATLLERSSNNPQSVSSYQLAVLLYSLLKNSQIAAVLAERKDVPNSVSLLARKRFGVLIGKGKKQLWLDPWSARRGSPPKKLRQLNEIQIVAYGLAFRAVAAIKKGQKPGSPSMRKATSAIVRALKLWPMAPPLLYARGQVNLLTGMTSFGIKDFQLAMRQESDALGHHNVGVALLRSRKPHAGLAHLKKAMKLDPEFLPSYVALARAQLQTISMVDKSKHKQVIATAKKTLEKAQKKGKPARDLYFLLGQIKLLEKDASAAVKLFRKEVKAFPDNQNPYFILARFYLRAEKYKEGAVLVKGLVDKAPKNPQARLLYAQFLFGSGEADKSLSQYRTALKLKPDLRNVRLQMAQVYLKQKKSKRAIELARAELKKYPNNMSAYIFLAVIYKLRKDDARVKQLMDEALKRTNRKKELKKAFTKAFEQVEKQLKKLQQKKSEPKTPLKKPEIKQKTPEKKPETKQKTPEKKSETKQKTPEKKPKTKQKTP